MSSKKQEKIEKKTLGQKISGIRQSTGMNLSQFARHLGFWPNQVWRWEHGIRKPSPKEVARIAEITGIDLSNDIIKEVEDEYRRPDHDTHTIKTATQQQAQEKLQQQQERIAELEAEVKKLKKKKDGAK